MKLTNTNNQISRIVDTIFRLFLDVDMNLRNFKLKNQNVRSMTTRK